MAGDCLVASASQQLADVEVSRHGVLSQELLLFSPDASDERLHGLLLELEPLMVGLENDESLADLDDLCGDEVQEGLQLMQSLGFGGFASGR